MPTQGVIYVAEGADYADLACQSAESLRRVAPDLPICLFTDQSRLPFDFDAQKTIPPGCTRAKIAAMAHSPFEQTLFLDCDTLVLNPLGDLFDVLQRFDMALCHDVRRRSDLIKEGWRERTPYAFPQLNSGVVLYRRNAAVQSFLADWQAAYDAAGLGRDQITLKDLIWNSDLRIWVLPPEFNLRRLTMLDAWEPLDALPTIIHSHRLLQHLRGDAPRVNDIKELLSLEQKAYEQEWEALGGRPTDPIKRFSDQG